MGSLPSPRAARSKRGISAISADNSSRRAFAPSFGPLAESDPKVGGKFPPPLPIVAPLRTGPDYPAELDITAGSTGVIEIQAAVIRKRANGAESEVSPFEG
jgi:hypothetical protein